MKNEHITRRHTILVLDIIPSQILDLNRNKHDATL